MSDKPIFDPIAFNLTDQQIELTTLARELGQTKFAERAFMYDREARFPTENYTDLHAAGLFGICIPKQYGGHGADLLTYGLTAAEIGRPARNSRLAQSDRSCALPFRLELVYSEFSNKPTELGRMS